MIYLNGCLGMIIGHTKMSGFLDVREIIKSTRAELRRITQTI
jgi:hypothetical protein